jgi:hypothetical protein
VELSHLRHKDKDVPKVGHPALGYPEKFLNVSKTEQTWVLSKSKLEKQHCVDALVGCERSSQYCACSPKAIRIPFVEARPRGLLNSDPRSMFSVAPGELATVHIQAVLNEVVC